MQIKAQIKQGTEYFVLKINILFVNWDFNWSFTEADMPNALKGVKWSARRAI